MVILQLRAILEYFILYLEAGEDFRMSTNIYNPDVTRKKTVYNTFKILKYNAEKERMTKQHHLSIQHCEMMGLILKFQQRLEVSPTISRPNVAELPDGESNFGRDTTGNYETKAEGAAAEEEEEEVEEEEEEGK